MSGLLRSWVASANTPETDFPLNNLPFGSLRGPDGGLHACVAIGDALLDVTALAARVEIPVAASVFAGGRWNAFMALGPDAWERFRGFLLAGLAEGSTSRETLEPFLRPRSGADLVLPIDVAEFTDFYSSRHHAFNVGSLFRDPANALPPNWLHMPIGYNGRASSVVVSGTEIIRPHGQIMEPGATAPVFAPSRRFDFELEVGAVIGQPSHGPVGVAEADEMIFGYVLLNDWSARDIQAWEYQPLGPFQSKATATTISPWIVTKAALEPFRKPPPPRDVPLLPYLRDAGPMLYDIVLEVALAPAGSPETVITRTNHAELYYSAAQQIAHHTVSGCPMRTGDLLGSGTVSGPERENRGSLLERTWAGRDPLELDCGARRGFLEDGDTVILRGGARGDGVRIGFGDCAGKVVPARNMAQG